MKMTFKIHWLRPGWKVAFALGAALVWLGQAPPGRAASADELFEKGIYLEETKGELESALEIYQRIVEDPKAGRGLAAQAQLRLGLCQLKLGNKPQAISALDGLTRQF